MPKTSLEIEICPEVLIWARKSMGYTIGNTAKRMGISDELVSKWEDGQKNPTIKQLKELATFYKRPLAVFFLSFPPEEYPLPDDFRTVYSDDIPSLSSQTRLAIRRSRRLQEITKELEIPSHHLFLNNLGVININSNPEDIAQRIRDILHANFEEQVTWRRENVALNMWKDKIENSGILVIQLSWPINEARALSLIDGDIPVILLNSKDKTRGRIFSLFHELAHLLLHKGGICDPIRISDRFLNSGDNAGQKVEIFCNHFAAAFLVPKEDLLNHSIVRNIKTRKEWSDNEIKKIGNDFVVSNEVILRRLLTFGLTTSSFYSKKRDEWKQARIKNEGKPASGGGRNVPKECIQKNGKHFVNLVLDSYHKNKINSFDVADYLSIQIKHVPTVEKIIGA